MKLLNRLTAMGAKALATMLVDELLWVSFLIILSLSLFTPQAFASEAWRLNSALLFSLALVYLLWACVGGRCALKSLQQAKVFIALVLTSVCWLLLQWQLPLQNGFVDSMFELAKAPAWFTLESRLSITPELTKWLFLAGLFELVLLLLTISMVDTRLRVKQLLWVLLAIGLGHSLLAIGAKINNVYLIDIDQLDGHYQAARGLFVNRNHLAAMVSLSMFAALVFQFKSLLKSSHLNASQFYWNQVKGLNLIYLVVLLVSMVTILLSQSRAGFLSIVVSATLCAYIFIAPVNRTKWLTRAAPLALLVVLVLLASFGQELAQRLGRDMLTLGERGQQWAITWQAIKANPWFGYGGGSYATVFQIWRGYADFRYVIFDQSHNYYLHLWLEQGLLGLSLWCATLCLAMSKAYTHIVTAKSSLSKAVLIVMLVVVCAALMQSLVDFNLQIMNIRCCFFVIIALSLTVPHVKHKRRRRRQSEQSEPYSRHSFSVHA